MWSTHQIHSPDPDQFVCFIVGRCYLVDSILLLSFHLVAGVHCLETMVLRVPCRWCRSNLLSPPAPDHPFIAKHLHLFHMARLNDRLFTVTLVDPSEWLCGLLTVPTFHDRRALVDIDNALLQYVLHSVDRCIGMQCSSNLVVVGTFRFRDRERRVGAFLNPWASARHGWADRSDWHRNQFSIGATKRENSF